MGRIGELLVADGLLSQAAVNRALGSQRVSGDRLKLGSILLSWDFLAEEALLATLAKFHRCPSVDWATLASADIEVVRLLPSAHAFRLSAIPYRFEKGLLYVAFLNPSDLAAVDEVSAITDKRVVAGVTTEVRLMQAHQKFYGRHMPGNYRIIAQKLDRKASRVSRTLHSQAAADSPAPDVLSAEDETPAPGYRGPRRTADLHSLDATPVSIPILIHSLSELPSSDVAASPASTSPSAALDPSAPPMINVAALEPALEDQASVGDDSLTRWVGDALTYFQNDQGAAKRPSPRKFFSSGAAGSRSASGQLSPRGARPPEEKNAGVSRPSPVDDLDDFLAGMWISREESVREPWEAQPREAGEAVLQNALTRLPRVFVPAAVHDISR